MKGKPFFRIHSATAWTTLAVTIGLDGTSFHEVSARGLPAALDLRQGRNLVKKSGTIDFEAWYREAHDDNTPWGDEDSDAFVTVAESAVEREEQRDLADDRGRDGRRTLGPETCSSSRASEENRYLLLDGVLAVIVDGDEVAGSGLARSWASARRSRAGSAPRP